jgi:phosphoenolpyruvate carboxykinase (ATP)
MWEQLVAARGGLWASIPAEVEGADLEAVRFLAVEVADDGLLPLTAALSPAQAVAFLVLNDVEAPGPAPSGEGANALRERIAAGGRDLYLLKAGRVGGGAEERGSRGITEDEVAAVLDGIGAGSVEWEEDPDFGYRVATVVPGMAPADGVLLPRMLYRRADRVYEHAALVPTVKARRRTLLDAVGGLAPDIVRAVA